MRLGRRRWGDVSGETWLAPSSRGVELARHTRASIESLKPSRYHRRMGPARIPAPKIRPNAVIGFDRPKLTALLAALLTALLDNSRCVIFIGDFHWTSKEFDDGCAKDGEKS
jgi:hypothetical protein